MAVQCVLMLGYSLPADAKRIFSKIVWKEMKTPLSGARQTLVAFLNKPVLCSTSQSQGFHDLPIWPVWSYEWTYLLSIAVFSVLFQWCRLKMLSAMIKFMDPPLIIRPCFPKSSQTICNSFAKKTGKDPCHRFLKNNSNRSFTFGSHLGLTVARCLITDTWRTHRSVSVERFARSGLQAH